MILVCPVCSCNLKEKRPGCLFSFEVTKKDLLNDSWCPVLKLNLHAFAYTIKDSVLVHICISRNAATRPDPQWSLKFYEFANFKLDLFTVLSLIDIV